jgi:hypothetical protein
MGRRRISPFTWSVGVLLLAGAGFGAFWFTRSPSAPRAPEQPDDSMPALSLPDEERARLWEIEHHGNLLAKHGFGPLAAALQKADAAALERLLAADFHGTDLERPTEAALHNELLDVVRHTDAGHTAPVDRAGFVERLLGWRRLFATPPKVKLALMGLSPVSPASPDGPWQGSGQLRLWGEHAKGKPAEVIVYLKYTVARPTRENLAAGGWLSACTVTQGQIGKAGRYLFREVAAERGIDPRQFHDNWRSEKEPITMTGGVYVCDFNRDGILDLLVVDVNGTFLYQGLAGGKFANVTTDVGLPPVADPRSNPSVVAAFVDLDGDGWEDLLLGDAVYRNEQGRRFVNVTARTNLRLPHHWLAVVAADFDRDGRIDLYVTRGGPGKKGDWLTGRSGSADGNLLLRNKGNWQFEDVTAATGTDGGQRSTFTAVWLDADGDGWPDLFVPNEFGNGVLYHNQGRDASGAVTFRAVALTDHPCDFGTMGVSAGDVDNDGRIDLYLGNMYSKAGSRVIGNLQADAYPPAVVAKMRTFVTGSQLHHNLGGLRFEPLGKAMQVNDAGWAYGPALADLDNDGWLDLYATAGYISRSRSEPDG